MSVKKTLKRGLSKSLSGIWIASLVILTVLTITMAAGNAFSATATLSWTAPTTNTDGTPLTDLAGFKVYYGTSAGSYSQSFDAGNVLSYTISNLSSGTYYFAATAYDTAGNESVYSNQVSRTILSQCTLATTDSGAGSGTVTSSPTGINCGTTCSALYNAGTVVTLTATPASGSTFAGWSGGGCAGTGTCSFTINANTAVTATFTAQATSYTITSSAGTGGSISPSGTTTVNSGTSQSFTITPSTGYTVSSVTVDGSSVGAVGSYTFSNVTANHTIAATFKAQTASYTITSSAGTGGSISPSGTTTVNSGTSQSFTITPSTGYTVSSVTVDGSSVGAVGSYTFNNVTANHTIAATFKAQTASYTITSSAGTGGSISPSGTTTVNSGTSQSFTITPSTGYTVSSVTVDGSSVGAVGSYTFSNVTANHTIAANFTANSGGTTSTTINLTPSTDTYLNLDTTNYSTITQANTYTWPSAHVANTILMKFDLSSIPAGATIQSATLNLYMTSSDTNTSYTNYSVSLNKVINHNPDLSKATGYTYDGTNSWTANTKCYNNIPLAQADVSAAYDTKAINQTAGVKTWNATKLVTDWITNPSANYGLMINSDPAAPADTYRLFASSKNATTIMRPYLTITYSASSSSVTSYTITSSAGTGGSISPSGTTTVNSGTSHRSRSLLQPGIRSQA